MPTYEYVCDQCGNRFDVRQNFSDDPITTCPTCTGSVRRVLHASGVIFKGSGWYITDSRGSTSSSTSTESKTSATGASNGSSSPDTSTAAPAAESKPASTAAK